MVNLRSISIKYQTLSVDVCDYCSIIRKFFPNIQKIFIFKTFYRIGLSGKIRVGLQDGSFRRE